MYWKNKLKTAEDEEFWYGDFDRARFTPKRWCMWFLGVPLQLSLRTRCTSQREGIFLSRGRCALACKERTCRRMGRDKEGKRHSAHKGVVRVLHVEPSLTHAGTNRICEKTWSCLFSLWTINVNTSNSCKKTFEFISQFSRSCGSDLFVNNCSKLKSETDLSRAWSWEHLPGAQPWLIWLEFCYWGLDHSIALHLFWLALEKKIFIIGKLTSMTCVSGYVLVIWMQS